MQGHEPFKGRPELHMTWRQWLSYRLDPYELILNCSAVDGSDFHQAHPIGIAVFFCPAMPVNPQDFHPEPNHDWSIPTRPLANAIFSVDTTKIVGNNLREAAAQQLATKLFVHKELVTVKKRLDPRETLLWYLRTPFTISPRGAGLDCHRTYEALICKSLPIVMGADESLRAKYWQLPVFFVDTYDTLTPALLRSWYEEALDKTYNFNYLTKSYWQARRPDVNLTYQSVFWLKRYQVFEYVKDYFREQDQSLIASLNPKPVR
jgi:hypothetical protein